MSGPSTHDRLLDLATALIRDLDDRLVFWSAGAERLYGYTKAEAVGQVSHDLLKTVFPKPLEEIRAELFASGTWTGELLHTCKDGRPITVATSWVLDRGADGQPSAILEINNDVTAARQAEVARRQSEELYRRVIDTAHEGIWVADAEGRVLLVNERLAGMLGYTPEEILGRPAIDFVFADDLEEIRQRRERRAAGVLEEAEFRLRRRDGSLLFVRSSVAPMADASGGVGAVLGMVSDVTERKRIERELHDALLRLRLHLGNTPVAVVEFDAELRVTGWSPHAQRIFGWTAEEVIGKSIPDLPWVYMDDVEAVEHLSAEMRAGRNLSNLNRNRNYRKDGSLVNCEWYNSAILDASGKLVSVLSLVLDVTEREEAQQQIARLNQDLARRVKELETLLEVIPIGIGIAEDPECRSIRINTAFAELLGIPKEENASLTGPKAEALPFRVFRNGVEVAGGDLPMQVAAREGARIAPLDLKVVRADGATVYEFCSAAPLFDEEGRPRGCVGAFVDITDRKRAEIALAESEARFRASQERLDLATRAAGIGIFDWIIGTGQVIWTEQEERLFGLEPGTFEGNYEAWVKRLDPDDRARAERAFEETVRKRGAGMQVEYRAIWPDGSVHWIGGRARIDYDEGGRPKRVIGTNIDLTERRRAEQAIWQKQKLESIGLLAGGIAHDFNNLLVGIVGGASLMREMLGDGHAALPVLEALEKSGEQAAHLTRQLLAYAGKGRFYVERVNLAEAAQATCDLLKSSIPPQIPVTIDCEAGVPDVEGDKGQIQQLLMNLLINAAEAIGTSSAGRIGIRIGGRFVDSEFASTHLGDAEIAPGWYALLRVEDTGCGMAAETLGKIYDPFFTTKFTGRGLGLAAVHGIVRGNKGAIVVASEPGRGTAFDVYLPAAGPAEAHLREIPEGAEIVVVIDDREVVCRIAEAALKHRGYTPWTATDGKAAVDFIRSRARDIRVVLLDMSMPGMSGKEILHEIRRVRLDLPVIVTSGYSEAEVAREFRGEEISGFLQKPFTAQEIMAKVVEVLGPGMPGPYDL